jgi:hypothetical protein
MVLHCFNHLRIDRHHNRSKRTEYQYADRHQFCQWRGCCRPVFLPHHLGRACIEHIERPCQHICAIQLSTICSVWSTSSQSLLREYSPQLAMGLYLGVIVKGLAVVLYFFFYHPPTYVSLKTVQFYIPHNFLHWTGNAAYWRKI